MELDPRGPRAGSGVLEVPGLDPADPRLLGPRETLFLALRGRSAPARLLLPPEEVFGRNQVRFTPVEVRPTDLLGQRCLHCGAATEGLTDMLLCLRQAAVVAVLHETCFKRWFVLQDKSTFGGYRFGLTRDGAVRVGDGLSRLVLEGQEPVESFPATLVEELDYNGLADAGIHSEAAYVRRHGGGEGAEASGAASAAAVGGNPSDSNILFCPHCDHPNKVPFLETAGAHHCERCRGRYGVKIVAL